MLNPTIHDQELPIVFRIENKRYLGAVNFSGKSSDLACLILPGSGPQDINGQVGPNLLLKQLAEDISAYGVSTLRFGKQSLSLSQSSILDYDEEYLLPTIGLLDNLKHRNIHFDSIFILGHSLGGHIAPFVASEISPKGIIVLNGHFNSLLNMLEWQLNNSEPYMKHRLATFHKKIEHIKQAPKAEDLSDHIDKYLFNTNKHDVLFHLNSLQLPFLLISCGKDRQVPNSEILLWKEKISQTNNSFEEKHFDNLNHLGMPSQNDTVLSAFSPGTVSKDLTHFIAKWMISIKN